MNFQRVSRNGRSFAGQPRVWPCRPVPCRNRPVVDGYTDSLSPVPCSVSIIRISHLPTPRVNLRPRVLRLSCHK
jgi:hypothetical protein